MANNYSQGTVDPFLPLTKVQMEALDLDMDDLPQEGEEGITEAEALAIQWVEKYGFEWGTGLTAESAPSWKPGDGGVSPEPVYYLYSENGLEEGGDALLQEILQGLPEDKYPWITFEGAMTCSKLRPGEFGGYACFITRDDIQWMNTGMWLHRCKETKGG